MPLPKPSRLAAILRRARVASAEEALASARAGEHLRPSPQRPGQLTGAPVGVREADLPGLRARLDEAVQRGAYAADWYQRAREATTEMGGGSPALARELAAGQAIYSPQATPSTALGMAVSHVTRSALEGTKRGERGQGMYRKQAALMRRVQEGEAPEEVIRGPKTGPYFAAIDPEGPPLADIPLPVSDRWMGKLFGYPERGYKPAEHEFMSGELLLAAERARMKGVLPAGSGAPEAQAAAWAGTKLAEARRPATVWRVEHERTKEGPYATKVTRHLPMDVTWSERTPNPWNDWGADEWAKNRSLLTGPRRFYGFEDPQAAERWFTPEGLGALSAKGYTVRPRLAQEVLHSPSRRQLTFTPEAPEMDVARQAESRAGVPEAMEGLTGFETYELERGPAAGGGAVPEWARPGEYDPLYQAMGLPQRPTAGYLGRFEPAGGGPTQFNPARAARPMVSFSSGEPALRGPTERAMRAASALRSVASEQEARAFHAVKLSVPRGQQDAARVSLPAPLRGEAWQKWLYEQGKDHGLEVVVTGPGEATVFKPGASAAEFQQAMEPLADSLRRGKSAAVSYGKFLGEYENLPPAGEGRRTNWLLGQTKGLESKMHSPELERWYSEAADLTKSPEQAELLRELAKGGMSGLSRRVRDVGTAGLPAWLLYQQMAEMPEEQP